MHSCKKVNKVKEGICLWTKRKIYSNSDRDDGITSDGIGMNGTTNVNIASQHCHHQMGKRTNACKNLGSVLGWKYQLHSLLMEDIARSSQCLREATHAHRWSMISRTRQARSTTQLTLLGRPNPSTRGSAPRNLVLPF